MCVCAILNTVYRIIFLQFRTDSENVFWDQDRFSFLMVPDLYLTVMVIWIAHFSYGNPVIYTLRVDAVRVNHVSLFVLLKNGLHDRSLRAGNKYVVHVQSINIYSFSANKATSPSITLYLSHSDHQDQTRGYAMLCSDPSPRNTFRVFFITTFL